MKQKIPSFLCSLGLMIAICGVLMGKAYFWEITAFVLTPARRVYFIASVLLIFPAIFLAYKQKIELRLLPEVFAIGLIIFFITDQLYNDYGLIRAPSARGTIIFGALFSGFWIIKNKVFSWRLPAILTLIVGIGLILIESEGHRITSDDHQTFLHRIILLKDNFPNIPFYDPLWNAGTDQRNFFATGALAVFFASLPWISFLPPLDAYNFFVLTVAFIFFPFSLYQAGRLMGLSSNARWLCIILGVTAAFDWYRWLLSYGTMGFICAISILPLNLALVLKFLSDPAKASWKFILLLCITFSYMLFWSPTGLIFLPLIIAGLIKTFTQSSIARRKIIVTAIILATINLPWIAVFWSVSKVGTFLNANVAATKNVQLTAEGADKKEVSYFRHKKDSLSVIKVFDFAREHLASYNPIILFLLIPGLFFIRADFRLYFALSILWLGALGLIAVKLVPQLELDRMLIVLAILGSIPAAAAVEGIFNKLRGTEESRLKNIYRFLTMLICGYIFASSMALAEIAQRRTTNDFKFGAANSEDIIPVLAEYGKSGRVIFSGCITHEMDGGHLAPFTDISGAPLVASSQAHDIWWYKQVIPDEFITRKDEGIEQYFNLMNASVVTAHERRWREYFAARPDQYKLTNEIGFFQFYKRLNHIDNYFLEGSGKVLEQKNSLLKIRLDSKEAVIKFRYFPFLKTDNCSISPEVVSESLTFIKIDNCSAGSEVIIKAKPAWQRLHL